MSWTDERINQLTQLWRDGKSASQIADILGSVTRNAVIGKAHRLGLSGRPSPIKAQHVKPVSSASHSLNIAPVALTPASAKPEPVQPGVRDLPPLRPVAMPPVVALKSPVTAIKHDGKGASILSLTDRMCKWPIGDPRDADFHFCGGSAAQGFPYCPEHCALAYQAPVRREDEKPRETYLRRA